MSRFYVLGSYSGMALEGFMKKPEDDRKSAVNKLVEGMGGKVFMFDIVRGTHDIIVGIEGIDFDAIASVKIAILSTGVMNNMEILEAVDISKIVSNAGKALSNYSKPGE